MPRGCCWCTTAAANLSKQLLFQTTKADAPLAGAPQQSAQPREARSEVLPTEMQRYVLQSIAALAERGVKRLLQRSALFQARLHVQLQELGMVGVALLQLLSWRSGSCQVPTMSSAAGFRGSVVGLILSLLTPGEPRKTVPAAISVPPRAPPLHEGHEVFCPRGSYQLVSLKINTSCWMLC